MKFKLFTLVVFLQFGQNNLLSQHYLNVPLIGQEQSQWCWAASIQMIHKFHEGAATSIQQCTLANKYRWFNRRPMIRPHLITIPEICCDYNCYNVNAGTAIPYLCDQPLPFSKRYGLIYHHYFDQINSYYGYNSMEDIEVLEFDWQKIVNEIKSCRPFAMFLAKIEPTRAYYNHVVVAKGYFEYGDEEYILVNDPQNRNLLEVCEGCEFLIPYKAYIDTTTELNSCLQVARSISPKDSIDCKDCTKLNPISTNSLISAITANIENKRLFGVSKNAYSSFDIDSLTNLALNEGRQLYSKHNFKIVDADKKEKNLIALVAVQATPQIAVVFENSNNLYKIKEISLNDCTAFREVVLLSLENSNTILKFSNTQYQLVEYLPGFQQFYQVKIENTTYLSPVKVYNNLTFKPGILYRENIVYGALNKIYALDKERLPDQPNNKCFLLNWFRKKSSK